MGINYGKYQPISRDYSSDFIPIIELDLEQSKSKGIYSYTGFEIEKETQTIKLSKYIDADKAYQKVYNIRMLQDEIIVRFKVIQANIKASDNDGYIEIKPNGVVVKTKNKIETKYGHYIALRISTDKIKNNAYIDFYAHDDGTGLFDSLGLTHIHCGRVNIKISTIRKIWNAYPKKSKYSTHKEIYALIGGYLKKWYDECKSYPSYDIRYSSLDNTCAVRMSRALNYCGLAIPEIKGKTYKGGDNMNYFIKVIDIRDHLKKVFKNKPLKKVARKNELEVIFIESECGWNDASGHVDILANNEYGIGPHDNCKTVVGWINLDD